ncbi:MAG: hypothetical protein BM564_07470 [Bacteroidetes bacterium MedPE-SWsnd-G2]|nr:MAG: hypothetical protein BM564_07470 [Bacteroidetes bacterium MedPE-SWsnd-G2]
MPHKDYIKVYSGSFIVVQQMVQRLEDIGIKPIVKDEFQSALLGGFVRGTRGFQELLVHETELDRTVPIVQEIEAQLSA